MSVLAVMRRLRSEFDSGALRPYCFIEINGLKLASPENIYKVYKLLSILRNGKFPLKYSIYNPLSVNINL
jgi:origin recognition complex subunit 1